jgi:hypothetical protein
MRVSIYAIAAGASWLFIVELSEGGCSKRHKQLAKPVELALAHLSAHGLEERELRVVLWRRLPQNDKSSFTSRPNAEPTPSEKCVSSLSLVGSRRLSTSPKVRSSTSTSPVALSRLIQAVRRGRADLRKARHAWERTSLRHCFESSTAALQNMGSATLKIFNER